ncbi:protein phosphatase 2c [Colletotrichum truncatum]|uniref:Protein phosphatase 2c n=1 Tax=Colletotrichum truncatum TaxID=5467 RepID=A0ACC3YPE0_COLTU|nr:protein phosphatase 2c [Colletotrichum truncatum]KAF6784246.1 protein phosphatase 2c [Colletotrichum truncatum]
MLHRAACRPSIGTGLGLGRCAARGNTINAAPRWSRPYSAGGPSKPSRTPQLIGLALLSAAGGYGIATWRRDAGNAAPGSIPKLGSGAIDIDALVKSPVDSGSFEKADAKIREDVFVGSFTAEGKDTHVHAARVASNHPVEDMMAFSLAPGVGKSETLFNGVYDGHAGWATSVLLKSALIPAVSASITQLPKDAPESTIDGTIIKAFTNLDDLIFSNAQKAVEGLKAGTCEPADSRVTAAIAPVIAGSCALLSIFDPATSTLRVACTGDSRAVLGSLSADASSYSTTELSKDQNGRNKDEAERLAKEHPGEEADMIDPKSGRLFGIAVTRAFGDHRWKWDNDFIKHIHDNFWGTSPRPKTKTAPYMTAAPVVTTTKIESPGFVILASDGLWDHISSEHAVECVSQWISAKKAGKQTPKDKLAATPSQKSSFDMENGWPNWSAKPENFVVEDLDNAAVHLIKNALGGRRRALFTGATLAYPPLARNVRDDVTVQVIFFDDPAKSH